MTKRLVYLKWAVCLAVTIAACSDDNKVPVDESKTMSALTADEQAKMTAYLQKRLDSATGDDFTSGLCAAGGRTTELLGGGSCETLQQACKAESKDNHFDLTGDDAPTLTNCSATVGQVNSCMDDITGYLSKVGDITCDSRWHDVSTLQDPSLPACESLPADCGLDYDLFGDKDQG